MSELTDAVFALSKHERNIELRAEHLQKEGYHTQTAVSVAHFEHAIETVDSITVPVFDIGGFTRTSWERHNRLRKPAVPTQSSRGPDLTKHGVTDKRVCRAVLQEFEKKDELTATIQAW